MTRRRLQSDYVRETFAPQMRDFIRDTEYNTGKMTADQWAEMCANFVDDLKQALTVFNEPHPDDREEDLPSLIDTRLATMKSEGKLGPWKD